MVEALALAVTAGLLGVFIISIMACLSIGIGVYFIVKKIG